MAYYIFYDDSAWMTFQKEKSTDVIGRKNELQLLTDEHHYNCQKGILAPNVVPRDK